MKSCCFVVAAVVTLAGCAVFPASIHVESQPEGLEVEVQGYRLLLRDTHRLRLQIRNAGDGVLYGLNEHEVRVRPGRGIVVDGTPIDLEQGERHEIAPAVNRRLPAAPAPADAEKGADRS